MKMVEWGVCEDNWLDECMLGKKQSRNSAEFSTLLRPHKSENW